MHAGLQNPLPVLNENISRKLVLDPHKNQLVFPALYGSNNFATIDYDAHNNTKKIIQLIKFFAL